jgi:energy-coupling factor transport system substrate-specific component
VDSGLLSLIAAVVLLAGGFVSLTRTLSSREIAAVASLGALSAAGRVAFAAIPSVQPSTVLVICSGWVLGPAAGFTVGATTALVSNLFLGQGPWTVWQMVCWATIGAGAGFLGRIPQKNPVRSIVIYSVISGFLFGWAMDAWFWLSFVYPHTVGTFVVAIATGIGFDAMHSAGNAVFAVLFAERAVALLGQFRSRMHVVYEEAPAHV